LQYELQKMVLVDDEHNRCVRRQKLSRRVLGDGFASDCCRSIRRGELTLTASKPNFIKATGDAMNVSEALSSSHQLPQLAGPP
jgi:hypothetical protein